MLVVVSVIFFGHLSLMLPLAHAEKYYSDAIGFQAPHFTLVKEALIEIGCVVTLLVGCHAHALWPNGAS